MRTRFQVLADNNVIVHWTDGTTTDYWCPISGGYVCEVTQQCPGTLGRQVCEYLSSRGNTLSLAPNKKLVDLIRYECRRSQRRTYPVAP
jgi:hypothetical protein